MGKPKVRSILYRLIEAGQLTHRALVVPLVERGLEPGDDAVLFLLRDRLGATEADLAAALLTQKSQLDDRLSRLHERGLIERRAVGPQLAPGLALTASGEHLREVLSDNWTALEEALIGEVPKKRRKALRRTLGRFVELLRL